MKSIVLVMSLVFSASVLAQVPATEAVNKLLAPGTYQGQNCTVTVITNTDSVSVSIKTADAFMAFAILNSSSYYNVDATTGEIGASQSMRYPRYLQGGTRFLNIRPNKNLVEFYISETLLDHRGEDQSSYVECTITR